MKSLQEYQKYQSNYFNSLSAHIENNNIPINESELILEHGQAIDSVLYKLNNCISRYSENMFFEGQDDALLTIEEQYAARDILLLTCKIYLEELCDEYNISISINEDMGNTIQNLKNFAKKVGDYAKEKGEQFNDGLKVVAEKVKAIKEFISDISSKAIKSAKEIALKFMDLIIKLKDKLSNIFEKLGGQIDEIENEFSKHILDVIQNKSARPKETIYEQLQNHIKNGEELNEELLLEFSLFGKKKDKEEKTNNNSNEYEDSIQKGEGGAQKSGKTKKAGMIMLGILKQIAISSTILIIIPALIGCTWGPAAAMIAATIAKCIMTGYGFYRLCKNIYQTIKTGKFKETSKWGKLGYIILWTLSFVLLAWAVKKAAGDFKKIWDAFSDGNLKTLVPDEVIQNAMGFINKIWKSLTGNDTPGFEELQKITSEGIIKDWEKIEETKGKTNDNFATKELKNLGDTNDFDNIQNNLGKDAADKLKAATEASLKSSKSVQDAFTKALDPADIPSDTHVLLVDGNTAAKMVRDGLMNGADGTKVAINQLTNTALQSSTHGQAGTVFMVVVKGSKDAAESIAQSAAKAAADNGVSLFSKLVSGTATETITKMVPHTVSAVAGGFAPIVALPGLIKKKINKGFLLRLGSSRTGNNIYVIKEDGVKGVSFKEIKSKYNDLNPKVISAMTKVINDNYKTIENAKKELEAKSNPSKEEKKLLNGFIKASEKLKDAINKEEYNCVVFYSQNKVEAQNQQETNESFLSKLFNKDEKPEQKEIEYQPVMFINPMCMTCGDLANSSKKRGPRSNPIYLKGIFASYEFLPGKEGMNENDIDDMLKSIMTESLKAAWNVSADAPCEKTSKNKYVENKESIYKDKERPDFGMFTNKEITEIFNDPSAITKYMSGTYSKRSTVEKENTKSQKERKAKAKEEWKNNIENNEEVKELIKNSPSLQKNLMDGDKVKPEALDELTDTFLRMETSYNKGKSKKSLLEKFKSLFIKDKDVKDKYDAKEIQKLAYKLASLHSKKLKAKRKEKEKNAEDSTSESLINEIELLDESIKYFDMNMTELLSEEFLVYLKDNIINESYEYEYITLIEE